ncbi:hypothetical protein [Nocardia sp. XZ_19_231]|uniref:hypothetical protein n=1 Tax=Nocardia sp. XZ_19_231 TaxID=2769252 RepID=UPI00188F2A6D|nr:hypothetical protein [Nocardia sp. XZ_19_231]
MPPPKRPTGKGTLGGGVNPVADINPVADTSPHTLPVSPLHNADWPPTGVTPVTPSTDPTSAVFDAVMEMPVPATAGEDGSDAALTVREKQQLEVLEQSIEALRMAFAVAGRALEIIRNGRLYRSTHPTFEAYVEDRWGMQRGYANKLIRAWPLANRLSSRAPAINEAQVRELLPVADRYGQDAAITVYSVVAEADKVTAAKVKEAVAVVPDGPFDEDEVIKRIRALQQGLSVDPATKDDRLVLTLRKLEGITSQLVEGSRDHPDEARDVAQRLREIADRLERAAED